MGGLRVSESDGLFPYRHVINPTVSVPARHKSHETLVDILPDVDKPYYLIVSKGSRPPPSRYSWSTDRSVQSYRDLTDRSPTSRHTEGLV